MSILPPSSFFNQSVIVLNQHFPKWATCIRVSCDQWGCQRRPPLGPHRRSTEWFYGNRCLGICILANIPRWFLWTVEFEENSYRIYHGCFFPLIASKYDQYLNFFSSEDLTNFRALKKRKLWLNPYHRTLLWVDLNLFGLVIHIYNA